MTSSSRPRYDDSVIVSAAENAAAERPVPAGTDSYGAFRARLSVRHHRRHQLLGVHTLLWADEREGTCSCGLLFLMDQCGDGLDTAPGHRALPHLDRLVRTFVTDAEHWQFRVVCQLCGHASTAFWAAQEASQALADHEARCPKR